jgi:arabinan endo-1,5-alpha-L-arabinosidase
MAGMSTRTVSAIVVTIALVALGSVLASPASPLTGTYTNPVSTPSIGPQGVADPFILRVGSTFHLFGTNDGIAKVPHFTSTDLKTWSAETEALPTLGSWANPDAPATWAPSVLPRWYGNTFYALYYTANGKSPTYGGRQCIGVAVSANPGGPYVDASPTPLVCQLDRNGSIDASPFVWPGQQGNNPYAVLLWKSEDNTQVPSQQTTVWNGLLARSGLSFITPPTSILTASYSNWEHGMIEAPAVTHDPAGGGYNLFYAGHYFLFNRQYGTGWATCTGGFGIFTQCTRRQAGQWLASSQSVYAPASVEVFSEASGSSWIVYHGYNANQCNPTTGDCTGNRRLRIDKLCFLGGVPRTNGPSSTSQSFVRNASCSQDVP